LQNLPTTPLGSKPNRPLGYVVDGTTWGIQIPIYVVGSYENACGGLDGIKTQVETADRIVKAHAYGHVLCEGLLVSKSANNGHVAPILMNHNAIFGFLDTPWDECLSRVLSRRAAAGNLNPFDPEKTMRAAYKDSHRSAEVMSQIPGYDVRWIPWQNTIGTVVQWLKEAEQ